MYALSHALPKRADGAASDEACRWFAKAARALLKAKLELISEREGAQVVGFLGRLYQTEVPWGRRLARTRHPGALHAIAWKHGRAKLDRGALTRAARAGSAAAAFDLATVVETFDGDLRAVRRWLRAAVVVGMNGDREVYAETLVRRAAPFLRRLLSRSADWRVRAEAGDPEAWVHVGYAHRFGRGEPYDPARAQVAFETAARIGSVEAAIALGLMIFDAEVDVNWDEAAAWTARAASSGDPTALWLAGRLASTATTAKRRRAFAWLRRAAIAGEGNAAYRLACAFRHGGLVRADLSAAERWGRIAIAGGHEGAPSFVASLLEEREHATPRELREAAMLRRHAASCGNYDDWTNWGVRLHEGAGVRRDDREAVRWYRRAAAHGCSAATANLGRCYRRGHGVRRSPRIAARWFRRAVEIFDNSDGAGCLSEMYAEGELGWIDHRRAVVWLRRAAAMGDAQALHRLGAAYEAGRGARKDHAFAALLYRAGAKAGDGWAACALGRCYRDGEGVRRSRKTAIRWFRVAIARGVTSAGDDLARLSSAQR